MAGTSIMDNNGYLPTYLNKLKIIKTKIKINITQFLLSHITSCIKQINYFKYIALNFKIDNFQNCGT